MGKWTIFTPVQEVQMCVHRLIEWTESLDTYKLRVRLTARANDVVFRIQHH